MAELRKLVYVANCTLADKKPGAMMRELLDDGQLSSKELIFGRKALSGATIGSIYEVDRVSETSWALSTRRYLGRYDDTDRAPSIKVLREQARAAGWRYYKGADYCDGCAEDCAPEPKRRRADLGGSLITHGGLK